MRIPFNYIYFTALVTIGFLANASNYTKDINKIYAQENTKFITEHDITYEIQEDGIAKVTQNIGQRYRCRFQRNPGTIIPYS